MLTSIKIYNQHTHLTADQNIDNQSENTTNTTQWHILIIYSRDNNSKYFLLSSAGAHVRLARDNTESRR